MQSIYTQEYIEKISEIMKQRLTPERREHSLRTADFASDIAHRIGYDENKAKLAAVVHDVARDYTKEQIEEAVKAYNIRLSRYNIDFPPSIHGTVGAVIAQKELGIEDEEILSAVRNHVSGRPCMSVLEEIIFAADHIDRFWKESPEWANEFLELPLDEAVLQIMGMVIKYDSKKKRPIDERTTQTFDWLIEKINNESKTGPADMNEEEMFSFYGKMDELLELCAEHALTDFPAENLRDLGGYKTADGHIIRKNRILRSGHLDNFAPEDFKKLAALGVNYAIDLRSDIEKDKKPDTRGLGINYVEIPFEATGDFQSYLNILLEWLDECGDPEESAWLAARYFDSFDLDGIYLKLLFDPESQSKFKRVLEIMLSDDCTGIVFFCRSGKDRTGIISSVIMSALGVDSRVILDDYMVSQIPYYAITMNYVNQLRRKDYNLMAQKQVLAVLGVESERPMRLNKEILKRYKDYKEYFDFEKLFTPADVIRFREKYLVQ